MKTHYFACVLALACMISSGVARAQVPPVKVDPELIKVDQPRDDANPELRNARVAGLAELQKRLGHGSPARYGFEQAPPQGSMTVLEPFKQATVQLDALQSYRGSNGEALLKNADSFMYPIMVGGSVASSMTVARVAGVWKVVSYGNAPLIRSAMRARVDALRARAQLAGATVALFPRDRTPDYTIITVTGLNVFFLGGHSLIGGLQLVPLFELGHPGFANGRFLPVDRVMKALSLEAANFDGKAPT
ncbi:MAG: hypothetical protein ABUL62_22520 [Myxococcales bacterium]